MATLERYRGTIHLPDGTPVRGRLCASREKAQDNVRNAFRVKFEPTLVPLIAARLAERWPALADATDSAVQRARVLLPLDDFRAPDAFVGFDVAMGPYGLTIEWTDGPGRLSVTDEVQALFAQLAHAAVNPEGFRYVTFMTRRTLSLPRMQRGARRWSAATGLPLTVTAGPGQARLVSGARSGHGIELSIASNHGDLWVFEGELALAGVGASRLESVVTRLADDPLTIVSGDSPAVWDRMLAYTTERAATPAGHYTHVSADHLAAFRAAREHMLAGHGPVLPLESIPRATRALLEAAWQDDSMLEVDAPVHAVLTVPASDWIWLITGADPASDDLYGRVLGAEDEMGPIPMATLREMASTVHEGRVLIWPADTWARSAGITLPVPASWWPLRDGMR